MRPSDVLVGVLLASTASACTEGDAGPLPLALGEPIGTDLFHGSLQVAGGDLYWMEEVPPASGEAAPSLRLRRERDADAIDTLPAVYVEQGSAFVVADGDQLAWGLGSALIGCGQGHWLRGSAPPAPLRFLDDGSVCRMMPLSLRDGQLLAMTAAGTDSLPTTVVARHALATDATERVAELAERPVERPLIIGDDALVVMTTPAHPAEGRLVQLALAAPLTARPIGATIGDRGGVAVTETQIVVLDNGGAGVPARVLAYPRAGTGAEPATVVATLPGPAHDLVAVDGALWMIAGAARPTGGVLAPSTTLWQVELEGTRTEFSAAVPVLELISDATGLIAAVDDRGGMPSVRRIAMVAP